MRPWTVVVILLACSSTVRAGDDAPIPADEKLSTVAGRVYELHAARLRARARSDPESLFGWSLRWRDAAVSEAPTRAAALAAHEAHRDRMLALWRRAKTSVEVGVGHPTGEAAARYYYLAAKRDLQRFAKEE